MIIADRGIRFFQSEIRNPKQEESEREPWQEKKYSS